MGKPEIESSSRFSLRNSSILSNDTRQHHQHTTLWVRDNNDHLNLSSDMLCTTTLLCRQRRNSIYVNRYLHLLLRMAFLCEQITNRPLFLKCIKKEADNFDENCP